MSVDLRRTYIGVPEQLLNSSEICSALEQMRRVRMPQRVRMEGAAVGERMAVQHPPDVSRRHPVTTSVDEERGRSAGHELGPCGMHIGGHRIVRRFSQG